MKATGFIIAAVAGVALMASTAVYTGSTSGSAARNAEIDRIIGDGEFNAVYPIVQSEPEEHTRQYVARVTKVVELLGSRDVSDMPQALREERARSLKRLLEYRDRGVFPVNYDHPGAFLPCFIDRNGAICAAGYLIEQSAGREFAEEINREYKYATIHQMNSPKLERWIASSGFTKAEIATIQGPSPDRSMLSIVEGTSKAIPDTVLNTRRSRSASRIVPVPPSLPVDPAAVPATPAFEEPAESPAPADDATIGMVQEENQTARFASRIVRSR